MKQLLLISLIYAVAGQMTQAFRDAILQQHNDKRRGATDAANMIELQYDLRLEQVAQNYLTTHGCSPSYSHNSNRACDYQALGGTAGQPTSSSCGNVGENWYSGAPDNTTGPDCVLGGATNEWTDGTCNQWSSTTPCSSSCCYTCSGTHCSERQNFYQVGTDGHGACAQAQTIPLDSATSGNYLHFTQIMWATTKFVGCGYDPKCGTVCNYAPGGNMNMGKPARESDLYEIGTPCSKCPSDYPVCKNNLCTAATPTTTSIESIPVTSSAPVYLGCYADAVIRDLNGPSSVGAMDAESCAQFCASYTYFGLQGGSYCYCGNSYGRYGTSSNCNVKCTGSPSETCGGIMANSVYRRG